MRTTKCIATVNTKGDYSERGQLENKLLVVNQQAFSEYLFYVWPCATAGTYWAE